jgi:O-antigen/teichoic acid export membrane protein
MTSAMRRESGSASAGVTEAEPADVRAAGARGARTSEKASAWRASILWLRRGIWGITDQALFALSNFVLNVALARVLVPGEYGAFALAYSIFLLLATVYTSLFIEPLLVHGAGKYRDALRTYLRELMRYHWKGTAIAAACLLATGGVLAYTRAGGVGLTFVALALAAPCILLQWLMRRACYVRFEPKLAALAGIWYVVVLIAGGYALYRVGWLTAPSAVGLMGVGSLGSALWIMHRLGIRRHVRDVGGSMPELVADHWTYGRWVVGSNILGWVPQGIYFLVLPVQGGLEGTAALRAMLNFMMPVLHAYQPLFVLLIPALVRQKNTPGFGRSLRVMTALMVACSTVYWLLLGLLNEPIVAWLYKGRYVEYAHLLWIVGLVPITGAVVAVLGSALRALERPNHVFLAYLVSAAVAVTVGMLLTVTWGVTGAAAGVALSSLATTVTMAICLWRRGLSSR